MRFLLLMTLLCTLPAADLLDFRIDGQGPFLRQNRGFTTVKSEGDFLLNRWAFGAWDANSLIELKLGQDADGTKYLALANLEGQPSAMFYRPGVCPAQAGETFKCTFEYRTIGGATGQFRLGVGEAKADEVELALEANTNWTPKSLLLTTNGAGDLKVDWRNVSLGADKALQLRKASVIRTTPRAAQIRLPAIAEVKGAQITETIAVTLHVAQGDPAAADGNAGTDAKLPLKTISAAMTRALPLLQAGQATRIRIQPGVYRESLGTIDFAAGKDTLLVIEGSDPTQVVISGSDVYDGWQAGTEGVYRHDWPHAFGNSYYDWKAGAIGHRSEMVFINRQPLTQQLLETFAEAGNRLGDYTGFNKPAEALTPGGFGVAERAENGKALFLRPAVGQDPNKALVEVAVRHSFATFTAKTNLVLRNLVFQHFANRRMFPWRTELPVTFDAQTENLLIEGCYFLWNNSTGAGIGADGHTFKHVTIRGCHFDYNGFGGFGTGRISDTIVEDCTTDMNGWRGLWAGDTGWAHGGIKFHNTGSSILRRHRAMGNLCTGIWYDIHCKDTLIEELTSVLNAGIGLFTEISGGPFLIRKSLLAQNHTDYNYYSVGELTMEDTILASVNPFKEKDQGLARFRWYPRPGNEHWEQEPYDPGHLVMRGVVTWCGGTSRLWNFSNNPSSAPPFRSIYQGQDNLWWAAQDNAERFVFGDWDDKSFGDFAAWKAYMGTQEARPQWANPGFTDAARLDFTLRPDSVLQPRAGKLLTRTIAEADIARVRAYFAWAGFTQPLEHGALTPPLK